MRTLKEQLKFHTSGDSHEQKKWHLEECVKITEKFAIEFFNWMRKEDTAENAEKWFNYTDEDMLNAFKEERGY